MLHAGLETPQKAKREHARLNESRVTDMMVYAETRATTDRPPVRE